MERLPLFGDPFFHIIHLFIQPKYIVRINIIEECGIGPVLITLLYIGGKHYGKK